jgi:hypothetical protein
MPSWRRDRDAVVAPRPTVAPRSANAIRLGWRAMRRYGTDALLQPLVRVAEALHLEEERCAGSQ